MKSLAKAMTLSFIFFAFVGSKDSFAQSECINTILRYINYDTYRDNSNLAIFQSIKRRIQSDEVYDRESARQNLIDLGLDVENILNISFSGKTSDKDFDSWKKSFLSMSESDFINNSQINILIRKVSPIVGTLVSQCIEKYGLVNWISEPYEDRTKIQIFINYLSNYTFPGTGKKPSAKIISADIRNAVDCVPALPKQDDQIGPIGITHVCYRHPQREVTINLNTDQGPNDGTPLPINNGFFAEPKVGGIPLDRCLYVSPTGGPCDNVVAKAFCVWKGFDYAHDYARKDNSPPTITLGDKEPCSESYCDRLINIECRLQDETPKLRSARLFDPALVNGLPLDLCRIPKTQCGRPAADAFCRDKGYGPAVDWVTIDDYPPTRTIGNGVVARFTEVDRIAKVWCEIP